MPTDKDVETSDASIKSTSLVPLIARHKLIRYFISIIIIGILVYLFYLNISVTHTLRDEVDALKQTSNTAISSLDFNLKSLVSTNSELNTKIEILNKKVLLMQPQGYQNPDVAALLLQIDQVIHESAALVLKKPIVVENNLAKVVSSSKTSWRERFKEILHSWDKFIIIHHDDNLLQPLITPAYESLLRESLNLTLQESQWAVLQQNQEIYQWALTKSITTIQQGFELNSAVTKNLLITLQELQKKQFNQTRVSPVQAL